MHTINNYGGNQLLSIIVPIYNTERYLRTCVDSIINQDYKDIEVLLIDDGSTDHSLSICQEYKERDNRIKVFHKNNEGLNLTRRFGVERSKGEYITFVDSDDWIEKSVYEENMPEDNTVEMVHFGIIRYFSENNTRCDVTCFAEKKYTKEEIKKEIIPNMLWERSRNAFGIDPSLCTKIIKRELLIDYYESVRRQSFCYGEDSAVTYPLILRLNNIVINQRCYYYHRQRMDGIQYPYVKDDNFINNACVLYNHLDTEFKSSNQYGVLKSQLDQFFINGILLKRNCLQEVVENQNIIFPYWKVGPESKVILYGGGLVGKKYREINETYKFCDIVLWVDKKSTNHDMDVEKIQSVDLIEKVYFDYIIIAVQSPFLAREISSELLKRGIMPDKLIWNYARSIELEK